jgi:DNA-binding NtrC family response regulator
MKQSVLVVDDDPEIRSILKESLDEDYHVIEAGDGHDGLSEVLVGEHSVDLVVTDLKMPGMDGIGLAESLPKGLPFIVISGYSRAPQFRQALDRLQPAAVFEKPFEISSLSETIAQTLSN